jgi:gamma-glutamylaminecyclotransferase
MHHVFVFGTLKEGFPNFSTNTGKRLPGDFITCQAYPFYLVGERHSPWMLNKPGEGQRVTGQVFEVDDQALIAMDKLERVMEPDGYRRKIIDVESSLSGKRSSVFVYLKQNEHFSLDMVQVGPLAEYGLQHAVLYRSRK